MREESDSTLPLWKQLRNAVADERVFGLQIRPPENADQEEWFDRLLSDEVATLSDWGLYEKGNIRLTDDGQPVTPDTVTEPFGDPISGKIDWDELRDSLHNTRYDDKATKVKAGQAIGCIRTFVESMSEGDVILCKFPDGVIPGIVEGPAIYDVNSTYYEATQGHAFYRSINWAKTDGEPLNIPIESLPAGFGPGRRTIIKIRDPSSVVELLRFLEWITERL